MKKYFSRLTVWAQGSLFAISCAPVNSPGLVNTPGVDITICSLYNIFESLACYFSQVILVVMVLVIIWYGFQMMQAGDNPGNFDTARKSLTNAIIGMVVILGAYTIIATVGNTIQGIGAGDLSVRSSTFIDFTPLHSCSSF